MLIPFFFFLCLTFMFLSNSKFFPYSIMRKVWCNESFFKKGRGGEGRGRGAYMRKKELDGKKWLWRGEKRKKNSMKTSEHLINFNYWNSFKICYIDKGAFCYFPWFKEVFASTNKGWQKWYYVISRIWSLKTNSFYLVLLEYLPSERSF